MTLDEVVIGALKNSGSKFKIIGKKDNVSKFIVECNSVKIHGTVTNEKYSWQIKKSDGTVIDESECSIKNTDDVINRIYENINTGNKLSKYVDACTEARRNYLKPGFITEQEDETDDNKEDKKQLLLSDEDDVAVKSETETFDVQTALDNVIQKSVDLAMEITGIIAALPESDIENKEELIGLAGNFYGIADDIDDVIDDLYPEEDMDESYMKTHSKKRSMTENKKILNKLAEVNTMLRNKPEYKDIREALKLIKSELILKK